MVAGRLCVMSGAVPSFAASDNPAAKHPDPTVRTLTFLHLPVVSARLLVWPQVLSYDWSMDAVPRIESAADPRNLVTVLFYAVLAAIARASVRRKRAAVAVAAAMSVASYVPASNALFYVGFVVAERVLYIPSVGYCLLVGSSAAALAKTAGGRRSAIVYALYAATVATYGLRTVLRNRDWLDEESLYRSGIQVNPPKCKYTCELFERFSYPTIYIMVIQNDSLSISRVCIFLIFRFRRVIQHYTVHYLIKRIVFQIYLKMPLKYCSNN